MLTSREGSALRFKLSEKGAVYGSQFCFVHSASEASGGGECTKQNWNRGRRAATGIVNPLRSAIGGSSPLTSSDSRIQLSIVPIMPACVLCITYYFARVCISDLKYLVVRLFCILGTSFVVKENRYREASRSKKKLVTLWRSGAIQIITSKLANFLKVRYPTWIWNSVISKPSSKKCFLEMRFDYQKSFNKCGKRASRQGQKGSAYAHRFPFLNHPTVLPSQFCVTW